MQELNKPFRKFNYNFNLLFKIVCIYLQNTMLKKLIHKSQFPKYFEQYTYYNSIIILSQFLYNFKTFYPTFYYYFYF